MIDFSSIDKILEYRQLAYLKNATRKLSVDVLNRRYRKLQELIDNGEYFSEEYIQLRDPILYQIYIGRYTRRGDKANPNANFCDFLTSQSQKSEHESRILEYMERYPQLIKDLKEINQELTKQELEDNEDELLVLMHEKFLSGADSEHFDYSTVDNNEDYDDWGKKVLDDEERYFDNEESQKSLQYNQESEYTGELDY